MGAVGAAAVPDEAALVAAEAEVAGAALPEGAALAALALAELAVVVAGFPPACASTVTENRVGTARAKSVIPKRRMSIDPSSTRQEPKWLNDSGSTKLATLERMDPSCVLENDERSGP